MKRIKSMMVVLIGMVCFFSQNLSVSAASVQITADKSSVIVGNTVTFTVTIQGGGTIGQAYGNVSASSNLSLQAGSSGTAINYYNGNNESTKNLTYTYKYKATASGTATITVSGLEVGILETGSFETPGAVSKSVTVVNATTSGSSGSGSSSNKGGTTSEKKEYSSDNNLSSLGIEGYEISPGFDKDVTEYQLKVDQSVENINVVAKANHDKASVSGTGEVALSGGENTIEVKVTAENGNEKVYKIVVSVEDLNPISVKIGKEEFTVVKKNNDLIEKLENYEETVIQINEQDVVAYLNPKTKVTLVLLKNSSNQVNYYIYEASNQSYSKYRYISIHEVVLQLLDYEGTLENYEKYQVQIQTEKVDIYKIKESHKVGLVYGRNVATGNTGFYVYDKNEETLSKYYDEEVELYRNELNKMKQYVMIFMGVVSLIIIIVIVVSLIKHKKKRRMYRKIKV